MKDFIKFNIIRKYKVLTAFISLNPFIKVDDQVYLFKTLKKISHI